MMKPHCVPHVPLPLIVSESVNVSPIVKLTVAVFAPEAVAVTEPLVIVVVDPPDVLFKE